MKTKKGGRNRKYLAAAGLPAIVLIAVAIWMGSALAGGDAEGRSSLLLSINGIEIPEEEFRMFLQDEKASTANYFYQTYGAEYNERFWDSEYGGEKPIQLAKEQALNKLALFKAEQQIAVEYGSLQSASYRDFVKQMNKEKNAYGADSLDSFQKYMVYHSKAVLDALDKFKAKTADIPEAELRQYYEEHREERFQSPDRVDAMIIALDKQGAEDAQEAVSSLLEEARSGTDFDSLKKKYFSQYGYVIRHAEYGGHEGKDENSSELEAKLKEAAYELNAGETSKTVDYGEQSYLVLCVDRSAGEVSPFDEAKLWIEDSLKEELFRQKTEQESLKKITFIDEDGFNRISMD